MRFVQLLPFILSLLCPGALSAALTYFNVPNYRSDDDSPFIDLGPFFLEDFEDGELNMPNVTAPDGAVFQGDDVRSVDGDDGIIDGISSSFGSFISLRLIAPLHRFDFTPNEDGDFPTFVGVVVTQEFDLNLAVDSFSARSAIGESLPNTRRFLVDDLAADFDDFGNVEHARFVGLYWSEGISSFAVSRALQLDHLQYGYVVPEPDALSLLSIAALGAILRRRR